MLPPIFHDMHPAYGVLRTFLLNEPEVREVTVPKVDSSLQKKSLTEGQKRSRGASKSTWCRRNKVKKANCRSNFSVPETLGPKGHDGRQPESFLGRCGAASGRCAAGVQGENNLVVEGKQAKSQKKQSGKKRAK